MRGLVIVLVFLVVFAGVTYFLLQQQGLLGPEGVQLLWRLPGRAPERRPEPVEPAPLLAEVQAARERLEQKQELLEKERTLLAEERRELERQRDRMAEELQAVREYRVRLDERRQKNVEALSEMLANMDAEAAAQIVDKLPESLAVDVLLNTKERDSGAILEAMAPDKAAVLGERIARAQLPAS